MDRMIPPIGTRGLYSLKAPWTTEPTVLYSCAAIREFVDLENQGIDVFERYYEPFGVERSVYETDQKNNVAIITLVSDTLAPLYVPSSYIAAYPNQAYYNYQHVVLSVSLGALPDSIELAFLRQQIGAVVSDTIGVEPTVQVAVAPMTGVISPEDYDTMEAARQAAIVNRTTDHARVLTLEADKARLSQRVAVLEQILRDNDLIPE